MSVKKPTTAESAKWHKEQAEYHEAAAVQVGQTWDWPDKPVPCGKWCHRCGEKHVEKGRTLKVLEVDPDCQKARVQNIETGIRTWIRLAAFGVDCTLVEGK